MDEKQIPVMSPVTLTDLPSQISEETLEKQVEGYINEVDSILININEECKNRFNWIQRRNIMSQNILYSKFEGVDEFIAKYI